MSSDKTFNLRHKYFILMKNGSKTIEGRLNKEKFKNMKVGDIINVTCEEIKESFDIVIVKRNEYKDFSEMSENEDIDKLLPGCKTKEEMVLEYHGIPDYKKMAKDFGTVAFHIKLVN